MSAKKTICFLTNAAADWGGASRVVYTTIEMIDRSRFEPLVLLPSIGPIAERLQKLGVRYVDWGAVREADGLLRHARDVLSAAKFFRRQRVDLLDVNFHFWRPAEVLAARLLGIPIVTHYHAVVPDPGPYLRFASAIAPVSEFSARNSGPPGVPKVVIPNSMILSRFDAARDVRTNLGLDAGNVVFSFIGQVREIKGVDLFIKMARALRGDHLRFLIVGECRDPAKFKGAYTEERLQAEIDGDRRFLYLGYRSDIEDIYRSSDVIVAPSRWGEPFALVNLEAGAAGKPLLAARDGGTPEAIADGENGYLFEQEDLEALIRHAQRLAVDDEHRRRMGARARRIVEERFTAAPVRKLERLYDSLIKRTFKREDAFAS